MDKVLGAFYEALRMFPSGAIMIRESIEDTVLRVPNPPEVGGEKAIVMPKGSQVTIDMVGVRECMVYHRYRVSSFAQRIAEYNPRYFPQPGEFKPSRWYNVNGVQEPEAYTAFSIGKPQSLLFDTTLSL